METCSWVKSRAVINDHCRTIGIYAFLLGAGFPKIAAILKCSVNQARDAVYRFTAAIDGLEKLKNETIPNIWRRGYFVGLDGRRVKAPSQHHVLAGMLQNGEAIVMKTAFLGWCDTMIPHKKLTWPHDEWQTEVYSIADAKEIGELQVRSIVRAGESLNLFCPMNGETRIGTNWAETH